LRGTGGGASLGQVGGGMLQPVLVPGRV